jgi:putative transposase
MTFVGLRRRAGVGHETRMPRPARTDLADHFYHIFNRANGLGLLFEEASYYREFLHIVGESAEETRMRVLAYCAMPNHWHMLVRPRLDGDLGRFAHRLTQQHSHQWQVRKGTVGRGALYQGRYKSSIIQSDRHLLTVCRYIERNPLRANLVTSALGWPWSSAQERARMLGILDEAASPATPRVTLEPLPVELPRDWVKWLDEPQTAAELERLRNQLRRGSPYGDSKWLETMGQRPAERPVGEKIAGLKRPTRN